MRHVGVLKDLGHEVGIVSQRTDLAEPTFTTVEAAVTSLVPDYVVVATGTARHSSSVAELTAAGFAGRLLIEKPLAVAIVDVAGFSRVGVGFNLRFHPIVRRLSALLAGHHVYTVEAYVGQHLSLWRLGRDVRAAYSARRADGGGALRDLSHEWDYLSVLLGPCRGVFARGGRLAEVTEDSDDAWGVVADYERAPVVTVQLNYLDSRARRRFVATTSAGTIEADLVAGTIQTGDTVERFTVERDDTYRAMHNAMLTDAHGAADSTVATAEEASRTDRLIQMIEASARSGVWVEAS